MAGTGFLRTVNFGGFDKKDVLAYVDELNTKIYNLENTIQEKDKQLEGKPVSSSSEYVEGKEQYEATIAANLAKISELMASVDTLNLQLSTQESELEQANSEVQKLKEEKKMLEEKVQSVQSGQPAAESTFDIGSVFIEAKHSADRIVAEAKNAARKMEDDSRKLSQQIIDEANSRAEKIIVDAQNNSDSMISNAKSESNSLVANANTQAHSIIAETNAKKALIVSQFNYITTDIEKLASCLNEIVSDGVLKLVDAKKIIEEANVVVKDFADGSEGAGSSFSAEKAEAQKKNNVTTASNAITTPSVTNVEELLSTLDNEEETVYANISESVDDSQDNGAGYFFGSEELDDSAAEEDRPSPSYNFNLDMDLLAGLTAEIEAGVGTDDEQNMNTDEFFSGWDNDQKQAKKISLVDDYE